MQKESCVTRKAETGVTQMQAKERQQPPEAESGNEWVFLLHPSRKNQPCQHFDVSPRKLISHVWSLEV